MKILKEDVIKWCEDNGYQLRSIYKGKGTGIFLSDEAKRAGLKTMIQDICDVYGLTVGELNKKTRVRQTVESRQMAHYLLKQTTVLSLAKIGAMIGSKDHATVLHSVKTINNLMETDSYFRTVWAFVIEKYNLAKSTKHHRN